MECTGLNRAILNSVRASLKGFKQTERNIAAWTREKQQLARERDMISLPSHCSDGLPHSRRTGGSIVERQAMRRERMEERIKAIDLDIRDARLQLWRIENALAALDNLYAGILKGHYINGASWFMIGEKFGYCEGSARVYGRRALERLARVLYRPAVDSSTSVS